MNKKITSAVLAGAMALSMTSISAFATDLKAAGETTLKATAAFAPVAIDVTLPTSITAAINPYKIDYDFAGTKAGTSGVISPVYEIENKTADYGVKVAAKVWATPAGDVTLATVSKTGAAPVFKNDNTEDKQVFAYLNTTVAADKSFANTTYTADDTTQVLFTEDEPDNAVVLMEIAKATGKGYFQIQGDCVEEPAEKWAATDKVELSIVFDINPFNAASGPVTYPTGMTAAAEYTGSGTFSGDGSSYTLTGLTQYSSIGTIALSAADLASGTTITSAAAAGTGVLNVTSATNIVAIGTSGQTETLTFTLSTGDTFTVAVTI